MLTHWMGSMKDKDEKKGYSSVFDLGNWKKGVATNWENKEEKE